LIVPHVSRADVYVLDADTLGGAELEGLADLLVGPDSVGGLVVPASLVQPIRARLRIDYQVEGLCFTYYRSQGYAADCVEALFAHALAQGVRPLWRIGGRQKVAICFAEKMLMQEIGTDGREVYLGLASHRGQLNLSFLPQR
jgi:hypothetical protein